MDSIDKPDNEGKQEEKSLLSDLGTNILDVVGMIADVIPTKRDTQADVSETNISEDGVDNISDAIASVKDSIVDNSGEVLGKAAELAGDALGGVANVVGEVISNIDL